MPFACLEGQFLLLQVNPTTLFLIEGLGQQGAGAICWGDGLGTDSAFLQKNAGSDPTPFFNELLTRPYLENVVIAPHYYGPSISKQSSGCEVLPACLDHPSHCTAMC